MSLPTPYYEEDGITIYCGDCREIAPQLQGIDAVISDPPYGMKLDTDNSRFSGGNVSSVARRGNGIGTGGGVGIVGDDAPFDPSPWLNYPAVVLFGSNHYAARLPVGTTLVWLKRHDAAFGSFLSDAEVAWMKGGFGVYAKRDLSMTSEALTRQHPCQKPVSIMGWCMERAKIGPNSTILDPFMGSGTTLLAAKLRGLKAVGIEINESYCQIAKQRLSQGVLITA